MLATCRAYSTKVLFDSCRLFLKHLFSHPASRAFLCLLEWGGEKETVPDSRQTFWSRHRPVIWTSQPCFLSSNCYFFFLECEHRFIDKLIAITEPAVASRRLLGLGSKLYPSNMGRMLNKGLIWFMQSFSSIFFSHPASRASFCPF